MYLSLCRCFTCLRFTLEAGKVKARVLNFGCVVKDILVPDKNGNIVDVCLGYDNFEGKLVFRVSVYSEH